MVPPTASNYYHVLVGEEEIRTRIESLADEILAMPHRPDMAAVVLAGAFVFAADLLRALARKGLSLPCEFLWLSSYGADRSGAEEVTVLAGAGAAVKGRHVLVMDDICDSGRTLAKACALLRAAGARSVATAVAVERGRGDAVMTADFAAFRGLEGFLVGYGLDDAGGARGLPFIARVD
jgi:hypoxanthine phosphoribosyltransferase